MINFFKYLLISWIKSAIAFDSGEPIYDEKYSKTKRKTYKGRINAIFFDN